MTSIASLDYQLQLLHQLEQFLKQLQAELDANEQRYGGMLQQLAEQGMTPERLHDFHAKVYALTSKRLIDLIEQIQIVDLPKVRQYQQWLEQELGSYR